MKNLLVLFVSAALLIAGCSQSSSPEVIPTISLDSTNPGSEPSRAAIVTASAVVVPVHKVELSFPGGGVVKTVEVAAGDEVKAGQPLVTLDTAVLEARVLEAEANVVVQSTTLKYLRRTIDVGASQERLDAAQANIDAANAQVAIAESQLEQATLKAPFDGTIAFINISPAEFANPGQIVITLGDLTQFQVETTDLSEDDVAFVKAGHVARVYIEALNQEASGKVTDVARVSTTVGGDVVYTITIELDEQPDELRWGMSAEVQIETE
jgi:RND family efflux transporter MFP subunit